MDRIKKKIIFPIMISFIIFMQHEQKQSEEIYNLRQQILMLNEKIDNRTKVAWGGYSYFAIGNSITLHPIVDYWWAEDGMAATAPEKDYFHIVSSNLNEILGSGVVTYAYNYAVWETQAHDRGETYELLDDYLSSKIDLVTVQLSENCSDLTTFSSDFADLLKHIKDKCGEDTRIIVIDDFWDADKGELKKAVCDIMEIAFVDLSDIRNDKDYMAGLDTVVYGDDGKEHKIEHSGVARHPGDKGMNVIAQRVLELVKNP